jgi:hypothetical protein
VNLSPGTYQIRNHGVWYPTARVSATYAYMGLSMDFGGLFNSCAF